MGTTWDGLPVARENPVAAAVVVWRRGPGRREYLVLHRHHGGPQWEGDWAWTPPSGARQPGEDPRAAAERELREETGLDLPLERVDHETDEVALFAAEAPAGAHVVLDAEHDRYEWVTLEDAVARCLPTTVGRGLELVDACVARRPDARR
jgi:8-oxo-dGTP pyrophosphatase MutT (NUDIX family)